MSPSLAACEIPANSVTLVTCGSDSDLSSLYVLILQQLMDVSNKRRIVLPVRNGHELLFADRCAQKKWEKTRRNTISMFKRMTGAVAARREKNRRHLMDSYKVGVVEVMIGAAKSTGWQFGSK